VDKLRVLPTVIDQTPKPSLAASRRSGQTDSARMSCLRIENSGRERSLVLSECVYPARYTAHADPDARGPCRESGPGGFGLGEHGGRAAKSADTAEAIRSFFIAGPFFWVRRTQPFSTARARFLFLSIMRLVIGRSTTRTFRHQDDAYEIVTHWISAVGENRARR